MKMIKKYLEKLYIKIRMSYLENNKIKNYQVLRINLKRNKLIKNNHKIISLKNVKYIYNLADIK